MVNGETFYSRVYDFKDSMYVYLRGKLNILENIEHLERAYLKYENNGRSNVKIDLLGVEPRDDSKRKSLDTAVISILLKFKKEAEKRKGKLEVYLTDDQAKIFDTMGYKRIFRGNLVRQT